MITPTLLREWSACWPDERITGHAAGRSEMSPREIAADETIDLDDRLWVLCHALWFRDEAAARAYAIDSAALVSHLAGRPEDQAEHARLMLELRRIYAIPPGPPRDAELRSLDAAWAAARDAARDAAWAAALDAALDAAWAAAWAAALDAAWAAARDAAWAAALDAALAAAWAAALDAALDAALAAALDAAWAARDAARDAELRSAIDRALVALGPDADGWRLAA